MFRFSVSKVKSWHNFVKGTRYGTCATAIDSIKGIKTRTFNKDIGTLADAYIMDQLDGGNEYAKQVLEMEEQAKKREETALKALAEGIEIPVEKAILGLSDQTKEMLDQWCMNYKELNPMLATQVDHEKVYQTHFGPVTISMRLDLLLPNQVDDIKVSKYPLDTTSYMDDIQGAFYTNAFDAAKMVYHHFQFSSPRVKKGEEKKYYIDFEGSVEQPYSDDDYIINQINRFLSFAHRFNVQNFLLPRDYFQGPEKPTEIILNESRHNNS